MPTPEDRTPLDDARRALAGRYAPLAWAIGERWGRRYPRHRDDILSQAGYGIVKAAQSWRGGVAFGLHADITVNRYIRALFRRATTRGRDPGRAAPLRDDPPARPGADPDAALDAPALLAALPAPQCHAVEQLVMRDAAAADVAAPLGLALSTVYKRRDVGLDALRGRFAG